MSAEASIPRPNAREAGAHAGRGKSSEVRWWTRALAALASLKLTLAVIIAFALALTMVYLLNVESSWPIAVPLAAFAVNLAAAVATNGVFRRQTALLVFHLSLIAIVLLIAAGRLTYLRGEAEVSVGAAFDGRLSSAQAGPLHPGHFSKVSFVNEGYAIEYSPGMKRDDTRNAVSWMDGEQRRQAVIGDQEPLVLRGYRFYTTHNKGFAPVFVWRTDAGSYRGTVHLPSYPGNAYSQAQQWTPPGAAVPVWIMLELEQPVFDERAAWTFRAPAEHKLIVRVGEERRELRPGDDYALPGGALHYQGLTTWMGYSVFYDPTLPWLLASALLAVASLAWHFWRKFAAQPWDA